jgi:hypothetical protein
MGLCPIVFENEIVLCYNFIFKTKKPLVYFTMLEFILYSVAFIAFVAIKIVLLNWFTK